MKGVVMGLIMFAEVMDLGVAVVAGSDTVSCAGGHNLVVFHPAVFPPCFRHAGLEETAAAAAAEIVGAVGCHVDEIFFSDNRFHHIPEIFGNRVTEALADQLAGVLNREFDFQILVPIGTDLQFSFPDPLCIILDDALDFKVIGNSEFFQSGPDCKEFVPSLGVEPDLAFQIINSLGFDLHNVFPAFVFRHEQAVIFSGPSGAAVCPVGAHRMQNLP